MLTFTSMHEHWQFIFFFLILIFGLNQFESWFGRRCQPNDLQMAMVMISLCFTPITYQNQPFFLYFIFKIFNLQLSRCRCINNLHLICFDLGTNSKGWESLRLNHCSDFFLESKTWPVRPCNLKDQPHHQPQGFTQDKTSANEQIRRVGWLVLQGRHVYLNWTLIFEWYAIKCGSKYIYQKRHMFKRDWIHSLMPKKCQPFKTQ